MIIRTIPAADTRPLRQRVLRPHQPAEMMVYPGDDRPETRHFGALVDEKLVGIASVYRESRSGEPAGIGYRLRGMAVVPELHRRGVGRALLDECLGYVTKRTGEELWCNARETAVGFYLAMGLEKRGETFELPGIGPHVVMTHRMVEPATDADMQFIETSVHRFNLDGENLRLEQFIVARRHGEIIAFGRIKPYRHCYELGCVGVVEAKRKKGFGRLIVEALIRRFPVDEIFITTDLPAYFERFGFMPTSSPPVEIAEKLDRVCAPLCRHAVAMSLRRSGA